MADLAPDRQATWAPVWLLNLTGATSKNWIQLNFVQQNFVQRGLTTSDPTLFASRDIAVGGSQYHGRILEVSAIERGFFDSFYGITPPARATVRLANTDGALDTHYTVDLRGTTATLSRYDEASGTTVTELTGVINAMRLGAGVLDLDLVAPSVAAFAQPLPKGVVNEETFQRAKDLGATIPVVFGNVTKHWCPYVNDNTADDQYDYLVGRGSLTVSAVYRLAADNTFHLVDASEYTLETTRYSGLTTLRFAVRQMTWQNSFFKIFADVTGLSAERNFARAVKTLLSDTTYGLGQSVNAASFTAAEALIDPTTGTDVTGLYCDGALASPAAAVDWLNLLLLVRGMRLDMNASGEWTITVDTSQADVRMTVQDGTGAGERNLLAVVSPRERPPLDGVPKDYRLAYLWDPVSGYRLEVKRHVGGGGADVVLQHPFLRDSTAADKTVAYLAQREKLGGGEFVDVQLTQEARQLVPGERVTLTYAPLGYSSAPMEVRSVTKMLDSVSARLAPWHAGFYTYTAGGLPANTTEPTPTESAITTRTYSTALAAPTGLTVEVGPGLATLDWDDHTGEGFSEYGIYRNSADDFGTATKIAEARTSKFVDTVAAGTWYWWVTAFDFNENESSPTASVTGAVTAPVTSTAPDDPAAATKSSEGVYQTAEGRTLAYVIVNVPAMPTNGQYMNCLYRQNGVTPYQIAAQVTAGGGTVRIDDLSPGQQYEVAFQAFGTGGGYSNVVGASDDPYTAPGDTTAPGTPSALTAVQSAANVVEVTGTYTIDEDWAACVLYRTCGSTSTGSATIKQRARALTFHDEAFEYATCYCYWLAARDFACNEGNLSPGASITTLQVRACDITRLDVARVAITTSDPGGPWTQTAETVIGTYSCFVGTRACTDSIKLWWRPNMTVTNDGSGGGNTAYFRIRSNTTAGEIIAQASVSIPAAKTPGTSVAAYPSTFILHQHCATCSWTMYLTSYQSSGVGGAQHDYSGRIMVDAKSV